MWAYDFAMISGFGVAAGKFKLSQVSGVEILITPDHSRSLPITPHRCRPPLGFWEGLCSPFPITPRSGVIGSDWERAAQAFPEASRRSAAIGSDQERSGVIGSDRERAAQAFQEA